MKQYQIIQDLQRFIQESDMTPYAICKKIGLCPSHMSRFLSGERGLSMEILGKLTDLLGLKIVRRNK